MVLVLAHGIVGILSLVLLRFIPPDPLTSRGLFPTFVRVTTRSLRSVWSGYIVPIIASILSFPWSRESLTRFQTRAIVERIAPTQPGSPLNQFF